MTSFIRTIERRESPDYVDEILSRSDHFIPLRFRPLQARPGDYICIAYGGRIIGCATIARIAVCDRPVFIGRPPRPYPAKWLVHYRGGWSKPSSPIPFRGSQGIRYVDTVGLAHLDAEKWPP